MRALTAAAVFLAVLAACGGDKTVPPGGGSGGGFAGSGGTPAAPCTIDDECPESAPFCDQGTCVECLEGDHKACAESAKGPQCTNNECGPCTEDAACSPGICKDDGKCAECRQGGTECAGKEGFPICNEDGKCVACLEDADCKRGGTCEAQLCVGGCQIDEDCDAGQVCNIPGGKTFGTCGKLCDPQKADQCPLGQVCDWTSFGASVEGVCTKPSTEGLVDGAICDQADDQCGTGLICGPSSSVLKGNECMRFCDLDADPDPCGEGFHCDELFANNGALSVGLCRGDECETDADCGEGMSCNGAGNWDGSRFHSLCVVSVGEKDGGEACTDDTECASGLCVTTLGVCYGACTTSADCGENGVCAVVNFGGVPQGYFGFGPICLGGCDSTAECAAGVECQLLTQGRLPGNVVDRTVASACWFINQGGGSSAGGRCNRDSDCAGANSTCVTGTPSGFCTGPCGVDTDCGDQTFCADFAAIDPGGDGVTGTADDKTTDIKQCVGDTCVADADCQEFAPGWTCQPFFDFTDPTRKTIQNRCAPKPGTAAGGERCTSSSDCQSGFCFSPSYLQEDCNDGKDNDADGKVDCSDFDCETACHVELDCTDGLDNDKDGATDCEDGNCFNFCRFENNCFDGVDNDADGRTDCDDWADCSGTCEGVGFEFHCADTLDEDHDGLTDCNDSDCRILGLCTEFNCSDGLDNEGDDLVDCQDFDCVEAGQCPTAERGDDICADGKDNDNDRLIDCADDSCRESPACRETACQGGECCSDGEDNDKDRFTDCADVDCQDDPACSETADECKNGKDDDNDGFTDCTDFDCADEPHCAETNCDGGNCCTNGIDDDLDGGTDCIDADCFGTVSCAETACGTGNCCADATDSDKDGKTDCADPDCRNDAACRELNCGDRVDNDGDGLVDCDDQDCATSLANCGICYQSCDVDADCGAGAICAPEVASVLTGTGQNVGYRDFEYLNSCFKP